MGIDFWGDVRRTDRDIGIDLWGDVHRMDSGIGIDLRGDANRTDRDIENDLWGVVHKTGHDIGIIKDIHWHVHNPNILASTLQIIKNHNYGNKPLFFTLCSSPGDPIPPGAISSSSMGAITLPGEYCFSTMTISSNSVLSLT